MKKTAKVLSLLISSVMIIVSLFSTTVNADFDEYGEHWYYSDDLAFRYWDLAEVDEYGIPLDDEITKNIDFGGATPQSIFELGKEDYSVPVTVYGETYYIDAKIGLRGDAAKDDEINLYDAISIAKYLIGRFEFESDFHEFVSDYNIDGKTDLYDVIEISKMILRLSVTIDPPEEEPSVEDPTEEVDEGLTDEELQAKYDEYVKEVVALINKERAAEGLSALTMTTQLNKAAQFRAVEISTQSDISHTRPNGKSCFTVLDEMGIAYYYAGENIAGGYLTPAAVVKAWMDSPGHRENILDPYYNKIGIGYYVDSDSTYIYHWTQFFIQD